jgi:hypothetical protein
MSMTVLLLASVSMAANVELSPGDDVATLTGALGPGDRVTFNEGVYELESGLSWSDVLGTEDEPVEFIANGQVWLQYEGSGRVATLSNSTHVHFSGIGFRSVEGAETQPGGIQVSTSTGVVIEDCQFEELGNTAVYFSGDSRDAVIRGNRIQGIHKYQGIYLGCSDASCWSVGAVIEHNLITDIDGDSAAGIIVDNGGTGNLIQDNVLADILGPGIRVRSTEFNSANEVIGNAIWKSVEGILVEGAAIVRNNVVLCIEEKGIISRAARDAFEDVVISHNTVVDTGDWGVYLENWEQGSGHVLANNAIANPTGKAVYLGEEAPDASFMGNVFSGYVEGLERGFDAGNGWADFAAVDHANLYPASVSALIGEGVDDAEAFVPSTDFSGVPRDGDAPGIGAYEYISPENPGWVLQKEFKVLGFDEGVLSNQVDGCGGGRDGGEGWVVFGVLGLLGLGTRRRKH